MATRVAVLIDGGFLRALAKKARKSYSPSFIQQFALSCAAPDEEIIRILYYDCGEFTGTVALPISGRKKEFRANDAWLHELSCLDLFAVRRGQLKFRGYVRKQRMEETKTHSSGVELTDSDFRPDFEQKGVDMRIGLDVAAYSANRSVQRIILVSGDTDCIPALKYGRKAGLQTVLVKPGGYSIVKELLAHADFTRPVPFPSTGEVASPADQDDTVGLADTSLASDEPRVSGRSPDSN